LPSKRNSSESESGIRVEAEEEEDGEEKASHRGLPWPLEYALEAAACVGEELASFVAATEFAFSPRTSPPRRASAPACRASGEASPPSCVRGVLNNTVISKNDDV
jgi:hypothetical protein